MPGALWPVADDDETPPEIIYYEDEA